MSKQSGGGTTTQTTDTSPWKPSQPYIMDVYRQAQGLAVTPQQFFPGQTYADLSPQTTSALDAITARAGEGQPWLDTAANYATDVTGGKYLGQNNPYLAGIQQSLGDNIQSQVGSRFANAGRTLGSPGEVQTFSRDLANASAPYLYQNYGNERQLQQQAAMSLPGMQQLNQGLDYQNLAALQGVGQVYDQQRQAAVNDAMARWNFAQQEPADRLTQYANLLGVGTPFTTTTGKNQQQQSMGPNQYLGAGLQTLGTGALAYSLFSDKRLKKNVVRVGTHENGLPLYSFRYVWNDERHIGHMSDEVKVVFPSAVSSWNGYDVVDYSQLGWV